jgi:PAS domain S-box-containing protein
MGAGTAEVEKQLYRDALEALPEAIAVFDDEDRFVFWNTRFAETYGQGVEIRVGTRFEDHLRACLTTGLVPNAIGREEQWLAERLRRFAQAEGAHEHRLANGRWVRVQDRRLMNGGRIGIRADITDFRDREQSFRLPFDVNPVPMIVADLNTQAFLAVNDAAVEFYG